MSNADKAREIVRSFGGWEYESEQFKDWVNKITAAIDAKDEKLRKAREALEFYAANSGLGIDFKTNTFMSADSDEKDFHGARARAALAEMGSER